MATIKQWLTEIQHLFPTWSPILILIGGAIAALATGIWTVVHYILTRRLEARQPFLSKQLEIHFEAATVLGKLVTLTPGTEEWTKNENDFWGLYWSRLSVVEGKKVEDAMVAVGNALEEYKAEPENKKKKEALQDSIYELAHAIRDGLKRRWRG